MSRFIDFEVDLPEATNFLDAFRAKQVPFATALALNTTGERAKKAQISGIFDRFEVRNGAFVRRGVIQRRATKRTLRTVLTVRDAFLTDHEEGGVRKPGDVTPGIVQAIEPKRRQIRKIRGRNTPRHVLRRKRFYQGRTRSGKQAVFERLKGGRRRLVFALERKIKIKPRLEFEDTVSATYRRHWRKDFGRALGKAIATAK